MDIWSECEDQIELVKLSNKIIRVVESQEQIATNNLVDDLHEQSLLEDMLENTKPDYPSNVDEINYLLKTPFRYPPLEWGSRFGTKYEPSLFYGSNSTTTAFAETAYYRFLFWSGMEVQPITGKLVTEHSIFKVEYKTTNGVQLHQPPLSNYEQELMHPSDYSVTQQLGSTMRSQGIEAFEFKSTRDLNHDLNTALFTSSVITSKKPLDQQQWLCEVNSDQVSFYSSSNESVYTYPFESFIVNGVLPQPA